MGKSRARNPTTVLISEIKKKKQNPKLSTLNSQPLPRSRTTPKGKQHASHPTPSLQSPPATRGGKAHEEQNDPVAQILNVKTSNDAKHLHAQTECSHRRAIPPLSPPVHRCACTPAAAPISTLTLAWALQAYVVDDPGGEIFKFSFAWMLQNR